MRLDQLKLATRLWIVIAAVVAALVVILVLSSLAGAANRQAYGQANAIHQERIKMAYQLAAASETNATRAYGVVVSMDAGVASAFKEDIAQTNARMDELLQAIQKQELDAQDQAALATLAERKAQVLAMNSQAAVLKVTSTCFSKLNSVTIWFRTTAFRFVN